MRCKKCDGRGWFFTPGIKSYGAKFCDCGAVASASGKLQVETRGDGCREEDILELTSKLGMTMAEVLHQYGTVEMIEKYITSVENRGFNEGLEAACKEITDNWDAASETCDAIREMKKSL